MIEELRPCIVTTADMAEILEGKEGKEQHKDDRVRLVKQTAGKE